MKDPEKKLTVEGIRTDLEAGIERDRQDVGFWKKWKSRIVKIAIGAVAAMVIVKAGPVMLGGAIILAVCGGSYVGCHFAIRNNQKSMDEKYEQQARLAIIVEETRNAGISAQNTLDRRLSEEFGDTLAEKIIEGVKQVLNKDIDKPTPPGKTQP